MIESQGGDARDRGCWNDVRRVVTPSNAYFQNGTSNIVREKDVESEQSEILEVSRPQRSMVWISDLLAFEVREVSG